MWLPPLAVTPVQFLAAPLLRVGADQVGKQMVRVFGIMLMLIYWASCLDYHPTSG